MTNSAGSFRNCARARPGSIRSSSSSSPPGRNPPPSSPASSIPGPTTCCCGRSRPRLLGQRIESHVERRKRGFVVTSDYVGPDRRKDLSRPSNVELFEPPNSLKMKAKDRLSAEETTQRLDAELPRRPRRAQLGEAAPRRLPDFDPVAADAGACPRRHVLSRRTRQARHAGQGRCAALPRQPTTRARSTGVTRSAPRSRACRPASTARRDASSGSRRAQPEPRVPQREIDQRHPHRDRCHRGPSSRARNTPQATAAAR